VVMRLSLSPFSPLYLLNVWMHHSYSIPGPHDKKQTWAVPNGDLRRNVDAPLRGSRARRWINHKVCDTWPVR